ncbi:MAG: putative serine protease HtrA [Verrucomicrobiota bacterium]|jgi:S1-C subfamily serine protease
MPSKFICLCASLTLALSSCTSTPPLLGKVQASELEAKTISWGPKYRAATVAITHTRLGEGSGVIIGLTVPVALHVNRNDQLGLGLPPNQNTVAQLVPNSAAAKAGLQIGGLILEVDGTPIAKPADLLKAISGKQPGDKITIKLKRADKDMTALAELTAAAHSGDNAVGRTETLAILSGNLSKLRTDFPAVFQHDGIVWTESCGGPLVDLNGRCAGINIARFDRVSTFALPACEVKASVKRILAQFPRK